jgi:hypothetical protein
MPSPLFDPSLSREASLEHHLRYNHFPPVDSRWIPLCEQAINLAVNKCERTEDGLGYSDVPDLDDQIGQGKTAREILDGLHLWEYVDQAIYAEAAEAEGDYEPKVGE